MQDLTPRQAEILELIQTAIDDTGMPPTRAEIAAELGFRSANAAEEHLRALQSFTDLAAGAIHRAQLTAEREQLLARLNAALAELKNKYEEQGGKLYHGGTYVSWLLGFWSGRQAISWRFQNDGR